MAKKSKFFELLAVQVAGGSSIKASAENIGCGIQHGYNISATDEFRQRVVELRTEITFESVGLLTTAANKAAATLVSLLDANQEASIRLNASKAILAALAPMTEIGELRARIDALENKGKQT